MAYIRTLDIKRSGISSGRLSCRGSKRAEVEHRGFEIYRYMSLLRESGLEFVGMSSVGPSIAIVTERSREEVVERLKKIGLEIAIETKVENEGLRMEWE
jgi:predicted sugar kinase